MNQISRRVAECGCAVHVHSTIPNEGYKVVGKVEIVGPCPEHRRPEPAAAEARGQVDIMPSEADLYAADAAAKRWEEGRQAEEGPTVEEMVEKRRREAEFVRRHHTLNPVESLWLSLHDGTFLDDLRDTEARLQALEARLATLERVAGYGPGAGDGYREIPAGERGEGDEG